MQVNYRELEILAKAIHYKNLSAASLHVGLSQPQLSKIIQRLEESLQVVLLDRSVKRKSGWTAAAFELSQIYEKSVKRLQTDLSALTFDQKILELRIGTLEGLSELALKVARASFEKIGVKKIHCDIFDLNELEASFMSGDLDIIISSHSPGRQKFKNCYEIGFQHFEYIQNSNKYLVLSTFEFGKVERKKIDSAPCILVSNSLAVKKMWLSSVGGTGQIPSSLQLGKVKNAQPVLMIGSEILSPLLWSELVAAVKK